MLRVLFTYILRALLTFRILCQISFSVSSMRDSKPMISHGAVCVELPFTYAKSSVTTDDMEMSGDNFLEH